MKQLLIEHIPFSIAKLTLTESKGGKMIFCGDITQTDLKQKKDSGIGFFTRLEAEIKGVKVITLKTNHRHEIVEPILGLYAEYRD